jgi:D-alanyl-D-alanine dipeptidase
MTNAAVHCTFLLHTLCVTAAEEAAARKRQVQLASRLSAVKPDLALAVRNARASNLTLSLLQVCVVCMLLLF